MHRVVKWVIECLGGFLLRIRRSCSLGRLGGDGRGLRSGIRRILVRRFLVLQADNLNHLYFYLLPRLELIRLQDNVEKLEFISTFLLLINADFIEKASEVIIDLNKRNEWFNTVGSDRKLTRDL